MKKNSIFLYIVLGIIMGTWVSISFPTFFIFIVCLIILALLRRFWDLDERKFLITIFILAICIRIILCISNDSFAFINQWDPQPAWNVDFLPDGNAYSRNAANIAWFILNDLKPSLPKFFSSHSIVKSLGNIFRSAKKFQFIRPFEGFLPPFTYRIDGFVYLTGFLYIILGYSTLMMKLLNSLLGVLSCFLIYKIAKEIFGINVAKLSLVMVIFFPSLIIWSISGLKDASVLFLTVTALWSVIKLSKSFKSRYFVLIFLSLGALITVKDFVSISLFSLFVALGFLFIKFFSIKKLLFAVFLLFLAFMLFQFKELIPIRHKDFSINGLIRLQVPYTQKGIGYKIYPERFYQVRSSGYPEPIRPIELSISYIKGIVHVLLEPFPWSVSSKGLLLAAPQNIVWYLLLPFSLLGMLVGLRYRFKESFIIISSVFLIVSIFALTQGNIGTVFRHRDLITPFCLMFSAAGIMKVIGKIKMV